MLIKLNIKKSHFSAIFQSTLPVSKKIFDRWMTPIATPVNISDDLTAAEFAADLQNA